MDSVRHRYEKRKNCYDKLLLKQKMVDRRISNLRLITFATGVCAAAFTYKAASFTIFAVTLAVFAVMFIYLVIYQEKLNDRIKYTALLTDINNTSLKRLDGEWNTFKDTGEDFMEEGHNYSGDLDIFGRSSLFQWINTATTFTGREKLRDLLSGVVGGRSDICERQEAVEELAAMLTWRQRFCAEGMAASKSINSPEELIAWGRESNDFFRKPWVIIIFRVCPVITILLTTAGFFMNIIPRYLPSIALLLQFALVSYNSKDRYRMFNLFERYNDDLKVYYKMLKLFESRSFRFALINRIKGKISNGEGVKAYRQIERLSSIMDSLANRRNMFYIIYNTLTLWDFQGIIALEKWKQQSGHNLKEWFDALGTLEALASLAIIRFENPDWVMPRIKGGVEAVLTAKGLGHPLIIGNKVCNDLVIDEKVKVLLITGSNMSGKSTFLRTAGVNLVLAYAGAPVCSRCFEASIMEIHTYMRVKDNLEENISSFYAELLRIKRIVGEAESGKRTFFLLDEIFKGTNSQDRHAGARVLVNKLSAGNSIGMVSTHDIELCDLEQKNDRIANYHFQEYYEDERIRFDYVLRKGPSTTRNAVNLMRMAGLYV